ncbi:Regulator of microtubule dynamics protein 1, variant 2 [Schistosoma haematobium]|uniref:Regulator of microtubule dynamics protein 1, variant 2 n=1 Tax=Schistosoma haematobium TaxID=6185 RepID=A0A922LH52_SCHHA|nr:Regulator of microtubule dynamics protein 1, variant 2 [Schistosoma haematobium]KAH9583594.1 Regulator of microtubule dynamics protein 1, variant 2 [Schistosoma haematobium]
MDGVIAEWEKFENSKKYEEAYSVVSNAIIDNKDPELYWRKARSCRNLANSLGKNDKQVYKKYIEEGLSACDEGLRIDPENSKCNSVRFISD